ncbi:MAG TPA: carbonic anhydrase [Bryobacteraceae bacterium]|nr:carbonic anhydrase [Bryobacteraceae bacterium]
MRKLFEGVQRFRCGVYPQYQSLFGELASTQNPPALLITCSDSRVMPEMLTQCSPGELFICRNAGNIVPPYSDVTGGVTATIEYAVSVLKVPNIIICGHSDCGAMKGVLHPESVRLMPAVSRWLHHAEGARRIVLENYCCPDEKTQLQRLMEENVIEQLEHLKTHPPVSVALARGDLQIYGWTYEIATGEIRSYDARSGCFVPIDSGYVSATPEPRFRRSGPVAAA